MTSLNMEYYQKNKLIIWRAAGIVTPDIVIDYYTKLKQCAWGHQANRFCDFSPVEKFELDYPGLAKLRDFRMIHLSEHIHIKLVMHSTSPLGYAMSRMYQSLMDNAPIQILVTKDLEQAAKFLDVTVDLLSAP